MDLLRTEISCDAFLELIRPDSGVRHVVELECVREKHVTLIELFKFSQIAIVGIIDDDTDLVIRFEEAAFHTGVIKDLLCTFCRLWVGTKEVKGLNHDQSLFATKSFLIIRLPSVEDVSYVWEEDTVVLSFGLF